jgi:hypothetical protein
MILDTNDRLSSCAAISFIKISSGETEEGVFMVVLFFKKKNKKRGREKGNI